MKKIISIVLMLMLSVLPAFAETVRTFSVYTENGALLIDENGNKLTADDEYDMIDPISSSDCPADRKLYMVSQYDLSSGFFLEEDEEIDGDEDITDLFADGDWSNELDDVDEWPVDLEELEEGFEMETIDDMPTEDEEYSDPTDDFGMIEDDYMDYGMVYGVALMNSRGELLTGFDYEGFWHDINNGVVLAYNFEGFVSVIDEQGNVLLEGMYTSVTSDGLGGYFAIMPEINPATGDFSDAAPIVHIAADGTVGHTGMYTFSYETLPGFYDGYMCVVICEEGADADAAYKYVFIDQNGQIQFGRTFEYASNFIYGVAEVNDENYEVHLINTDGEYVTSEQYSYFELGAAGDNMPIIGNLASGGFDIISKEDHSVITSIRPEEGMEYMSAYITNDGFIMIYTSTVDMMMDIDGNVLWRGTPGESFIQPGHEVIDSTPERVVLYNQTDDGYSCTIVDMSINAVSGAYREIYPMSWLNGEGRYQAINYDVIQQEYYGEIIMETDFDTMRFGVLDQDGNEIVPLEYNYFMYLDHDRYWVGNGVNYTLIDSNGSIIAEFPVER